MLSLLPTDTQKSATAAELRPNGVWAWAQTQFPLLSFLAQRVAVAAVTFVIITAVVYAMTLIVPAEERARPYLPPRIRYDPIESVRFYTDIIIETYGLDDPFPIQYGRWLGELLQGDWGYSSILRVDVLDALSARSAATLELTIISLLIYIPLGLLIGAWAAWRQGRLADHGIRAAAYIGTTIPPFILGLMFIAIVYVQMGLFDLSRIGYQEQAIIQSQDFWPITGFITLDGLLNFRPDISWQGLRHLVLPVATLITLHLSSLILVTRNSVAEELQKEYILLARGVGMRDRNILFRYALRNALLPALTHSALTAAQVVTGVYVVEAIFNWHGVSELLTDSLGSIPDVDLALGFCVYSILVVLSIMLVLDIVQGLVDPRVRQGKA